MRLKQRHLDPCDTLAQSAGSVPHSVQPGGDHLRVVQHQPVARPQETGQVDRTRIGEPVTLRHQHPRRGSRPRRPGRDQPLGQVEIEIAQLHSASVRCGGVLRKISRNIPGVSIDSGLAETRGSEVGPDSVNEMPRSPSPLRVKIEPMTFTK